jgi:hypothetical protein
MHLAQAEPFVDRSHSAMLCFTRSLIMWAIRAPAILVLSTGVFIACVADRESVRTTSAPSPTPSVPVEDASQTSLPDASAPEAAAQPPIDAAADVASVDAAPQKPLALKGIRKCTASEIKDEMCVERGKAGLCLDEYCVTLADCPRYCTASAARDHAECKSDPKECAGVPECIRVMQENNRNCDALRTQLLNHCRTGACSTIRILPAP